MWTVAVYALIISLFLRGIPRKILSGFCFVTCILVLLYFAKIDVIGAVVEFVGDIFYFDLDLDFGEDWGYFNTRKFLIYKFIDNNPFWNLLLYIDKATELELLEKVFIALLPEFLISLFVFLTDYRIITAENGKKKLKIGFINCPHKKEKENKTMENSETTVQINVVNKGREKNKWIAVLLCFFLGEFGIHRFYEGKILTGILWLFTGGFFVIGWIIDFIILLFKPNPYYV